MLLPSEIEAKYTIPALRAVAARKLVEEHRKKQQEVGEILGVTQAAVSNYIRGARSGELGWEEDEHLRSVLDRLVSRLVDSEDEIETVKAFNTACDEIRRSRLLCEVHKRLDESFDVENCDACESRMLQFRRTVVDTQKVGSSPR
jgi:hypothetical protein